MTLVGLSPGLGFICGISQALHWCVRDRTRGYRYRQRFWGQGWSAAIKRGCPVSNLSSPLGDPQV